MNGPTPEFYAKVLFNTEGITPTETEIELLATKIEEEAFDMADATDNLNDVAKALYRSIGKGKLRAYMDKLLQEDAAHQEVLWLRYKERTDFGPQH